MSGYFKQDISLHKSNSIYQQTNKHIIVPEFIRHSLGRNLQLRDNQQIQSYNTAQKINLQIQQRCVKYRVNSTNSDLIIKEIQEQIDTIEVEQDEEGIQEEEEKVGVLLLNLGGPESLADVQPFLYNLFADPDIIRLPKNFRWAQSILAYLISMLRAPKSREGYKEIGGGSPLRSITNQQATAIEKCMDEKGVKGKVYVGMRYWNPYTEEAIKQIKQDNIQKLVVLPLYPQFSISTSGSSLRLMEELFKNDAQLSKMQHIVIPSWYERKGYVKATCDLIEQQLKAFPEVESVNIFFSAHGVPKSYVDEAGDPYKEEMEQCVNLIMQELNLRGYNNNFTLAYQSRVGPVEWLKPYTDETIRQLAQDGVRSLLAVPISFVSEHIETLEEIDGEYQELARDSGIQYWGRVPALNTNPTFIDDLANAVIEALPFVGSMVGANDSLVPMGDIDTLLETYDKERKQLPSPSGVFWKWGWTMSAELWNGRIAMVAIALIVIIEATTGRGILSQ